MIDPEDAITQGKLTQLANNIKKAGPITSIEGIVEYQQPSVDDKIDEVEAENNVEKAETGKAIERVKDSLKEGECPICCEDLADDEVDIIIMKCCGKTLCSDCVKEGTNMRNVGNNVQGKCPNCRTVVGFNQLIFINKNMDLDAVINEDLDAHIDSEEEEVEPEEEAEPEENVTTKFGCCVGIIQGKTYKKQRKTAKITIAGTMVGERDLPEANPDERKHLVYAMHHETQDKLSVEFDKHGIKYTRLQGTAKQIQRIVKRYKLPNKHQDAINVLIISGPKFVAGLNLQNTTDLHYMHVVIDAAINSQIAGRAIRVGRTKNLNIHYYLYRNEFGLMGLTP